MIKNFMSNKNENSLSSLSRPHTSSPFHHSSVKWKKKEMERERRCPRECEGHESTHQCVHTSAPSCGEAAWRGVPTDVPLGEWAGGGPAGGVRVGPHTPHTVPHTAGGGGEVGMRVCGEVGRWGGGCVQHTTDSTHTTTTGCVCVMWYEGREQWEMRDEVRRWGGGGGGWNDGRWGWWMGE